MAITRTGMNTAVMEQSTNNHHNEDVHVEDQIDLSSIVKRLQAQVSEMQKHHVEEIVTLRCENAYLWEAHMPR
ncbi:hypothetical protein JHK82_034210 [Glycine max]|nr:hypothetical protein JHK85_034924 [Glycine max]KAG4986589.1 hypothetical protein JHK86_034280 [Glycine max]KAG5119790.1 hypothetical protein JHK82_034210 [Glycine max]KAG5140781.1 hypothetical protein JHK84_034549 [Glycine max]